MGLTPLCWTYAGDAKRKHGAQRVHAGDDVYVDKETADGCARRASRVRTPTVCAVAPGCWPKAERC